MASSFTRTGRKGSFMNLFGGQATYWRLPWVTGKKETSAKQGGKIMKKRCAYLFALAVLILVHMGMPPAARAGTYHFYHKNGDGSFNVHVWEDDGSKSGKWLGTYYYDKNGKYLGSADPNPEGDGSEGTADLESLLAELKKKLDGGDELPRNFWKSPAGHMLIKTGKGPQPGDPIDPDPGGSLAYDADGAGGGSGGIDPNGGPIGDQIGRKKGSNGNDDDDDGDGGGSGDDSIWGEEYPADPELVNPVPETVAGSHSTEIKEIGMAAAPGKKIELGDGMQSKSGEGPQGFGGSEPKTLAKYSAQDVVPVLVLKGAGNVKTLYLTAGKSSAALFSVLNRGDTASAAMVYSVSCRKQDPAAGNCPAFQKRGYLGAMAPQASRDIKIGLSSVVAGKYDLTLKLATGAEQTVMLDVAAKTASAPGAVARRPANTQPGAAQRRP